MPIETLHGVALEQKIQTELARRGWSLAAEPSLFAAGETFLLRVCQCAARWHVEKQRPLDDALNHDAIIHEYCRLLHAAVSQNGSRVQSDALQETINYAWPVALNRCNDQKMAESAILRAVNQAWLHIASCDPGKYLAWFARILQREIQQEMRTRQRLQNHETTEADLPMSEESDDLDVDPLEFVHQRIPSDSPTTHEIDLSLSRKRLFELLKICLDGAKREFIVLAHFFAELNPNEMARLLRISVNQVYLCKHRALARLRDCPDVVAELFLLLN